MAMGCEAMAGWKSGLRKVDCDSTSRCRMPRQTEILNSRLLCFSRLPTEKNRLAANRGMWKRVFLQLR
jgi:hypothetical protein